MKNKVQKINGENENALALNRKVSSSIALKRNTLFDEMKRNVGYEQ